MEDIRTILSQFHSKKRKDEGLEKTGASPVESAVSSQIPDVFFDVILQRYKLNRQEISVLMYLYRQVWCRPNLYRAHGIGPMNSLAELSQILGITIDELHHHLRSLHTYGFIDTVRSGQYFVRKFFTEELDRKFGQGYDDFF